MNSQETNQLTMEDIDLDIFGSSIIIAEFMGWTPSVMEGKGGINLMYFPDSSKEQIYQCKQMDVAGMNYHKSWDEFMPVVDKINKLENPRKDGDTTLSTLKQELRAFVGKVCMPKAFEYAVKTIVWYNKAIRKLS